MKKVAAMIRRHLDGLLAYCGPRNESSLVLGD